MAGHDDTEAVHLPDDFQGVECPEPAEGLSYVYILCCRNGSFYIGQSHDLRQRLVRNAEGTGARHTRQMKDFGLVFVEGPMASEVAIKRERQLKKWSRARKAALIRGDLEKLKRLSQSRD